jgi:transcriptional regulator with XRE-family HTH domain
MTIGSRIKELRKKEGLTQKGLAAKVGVEYQAIQQWEKDKTAPKLKYQDELATALKTSKQYLMYGSDAPVDHRLDQRRHAIIEIVKIVPENTLDWLHVQAGIALSAKVFKKPGKAKKRS